MTDRERASLYVVDTNTINEWEDYYPGRFRTFWKNNERLIDDRRLTSVRQVRKEIHNTSISDHIHGWVEKHETLFAAPTVREMEFVREMFSIEHCQGLISERKRQTYNPVADPWLIARAKVQGGGVVTEEVRKPNAPKIPNIFEYFDVGCYNLREMMEREKWEFGSSGSVIGTVS